MLTDLMTDQQQKLVRKLQEKPHIADPETVTALALLDILDVLGDIRNPSGSPQDS